MEIIKDLYKRLRFRPTPSPARGMGVAPDPVKKIISKLFFLSASLPLSLSPSSSMAVRQTKSDV
jgi:hypothetical protein